jgi:hypothetical protein
LTPSLALTLGAVSEAVRALLAPALEAVLGATSGVKQALLVSVKEEEQRPLKQQCIKQVKDFWKLELVELYYNPWA